MIKLIQFPSGGGIANLSPFCLKLETWLRLAELPYECSYAGDPSKGPLGKLPAIVLDGKTIGDSSVCIEALQQRFAIDQDRHLDPAQRATSLAFKTLFEDHFYWTLVYSRWEDERIWPKTRETFFGQLPPGLRQLIPVVARRKVQGYLQGQGMGRHSREQIYRFAEQDLSAFAEWLGDKSFCFGDEPCTLDAIAYGFLAQVTQAELKSPLHEIAAKYPDLHSYCQRMQNRCFAVEKQSQESACDAMSTAS